MTWVLCGGSKGCFMSVYMVEMLRCMYFGSILVWESEKGKVVTYHLHGKPNKEVQKVTR